MSRVEAYFDHLHEIPELGHKETETAAYLTAQLQALGYRVTEGVGGSTGVVGTLAGLEPGKVFALRGDMDALPFCEAGEETAYHACGHDANCAMVLEAARRIAEAGVSKGCVKIVFQPGEEVEYGSRSVIDSGLLSDLDEIAAIHLMPKDEIPLGQASPAVLHCASTQMRVRFHGRAAHASKPHLGVNALSAAAAAIAAIGALHGNPAIEHSVKVTQLCDGGNPPNTIPDSASMNVDLRSAENEEMELLIEKTRDAVRAAAETVGARAVVENVDFCPGSIYDESMKQTAEESIREVLGEDASVGEVRNLVGEDFHYYAKLLGCAAAYIGLGADLTPGLHMRDMTFDRRSLAYGADVLYTLASRRLHGG